jgi:hypothetical protein
VVEKSQFDAEKLTHEYAWNWFCYHAGQRMTVFRFFFLVIGVIAVGYHQTLGSAPHVAFAFSVLGTLLSLLFWRLDLRTRELIRIGENLLLELEPRFSNQAKIKVALVEQARTKASPHQSAPLPRILYSYGQVFSTIFGILLFSSILSAVYAAHRAGWLAY